MRILTCSLASVVLAVLPAPQVVQSFSKISSTQGGFTGPLADGDYFGVTADGIGDLDGDGVAEIAVGAQWDDEAGGNAGAVWILFLAIDGNVRAEAKITEGRAGFTGNLEPGDYFGSSVANLGDLDGDGSPEIAVGAMTGGGQGKVWVLSLTPTAQVKSTVLIAPGSGGFTGALGSGDIFGDEVASAGDIDGDGLSDLAVGAIRDGDGGPLRGAVWILFLNADGTVRTYQKISSTQGGFTGSLDDGDQFGVSIDTLGDLDGDGVPDLAVGENTKSVGPHDGAIWILLLNSDGTVRAQQKISATEGGFTGLLDPGDLFGYSVAFVGDLDGDGIQDLAAGAIYDDDGGIDRGAVWLINLNRDGTVHGQEKISYTEGGFLGILDDTDNFGSGLCPIADPRGGGGLTLIVGANQDDDGGIDRGAAWLVNLGPTVPTAAVLPYGCGVNPAGSLTVLSGLPVLGTTMILGIDNPLGTQAIGSVPVLVLAGAPDPAFPCGTRVPGFGMNGDGELLLGLSSLLLPFSLGFAWQGPGTPAPIAVGVPNDPTLLGISVYSQGLMLDPSGAGPRFAFTGALELVAGG